MSVFFASKRWFHTGAPSNEAATCRVRHPSPATAHGGRCVAKSWSPGRGKVEHMYFKQYWMGKIRDTVETDQWTSPSKEFWGGASGAAPVVAAQSGGQISGGAAAPGPATPGWGRSWSHKGFILFGWAPEDFRTKNLRNSLNKTVVLFFFLSHPPMPMIHLGVNSAARGIHSCLISRTAAGRVVAPASNCPTCWFCS